MNLDNKEKVCDKTKNNKENQRGWKLEHSYWRLPEKLFSCLMPEIVPSPSLVILNEALAEELELNIGELKSRSGVKILAGNSLPKGREPKKALSELYETEGFMRGKHSEQSGFFLPLAQAYAGHQFGHFAMLGDGRALLLGEQVLSDGRRYDIQLKGSGRTPYSRRGDGKAALGPMLREYIISEAMYALGIPTTRSLAVVTTGEPVFREKKLKGAVLTRTAESHLRIATFQYAAHLCTGNELKELADYTLERHFPEGMETENPYLYLLTEVMTRQAQLVAKWQLVGFIHGVMNTDNMSIIGETIDYGPCAFMDKYDPATVFSSIDTEGRYAFGNQQDMAGWNLARFAEALIPLIHHDREKAAELAQNELSKFSALYEGYLMKGMEAKLGIFGSEEADIRSCTGKGKREIGSDTGKCSRSGRDVGSTRQDEQSHCPSDRALIQELLSLMYKYGADYTNTFASLTAEVMEASAGTLDSHIRECFGGITDFDSRKDFGGMTNSDSKKEFCGANSSDNSGIFHMATSEEFLIWKEKWKSRLKRQSQGMEQCCTLMQGVNPSVIPRNHRVEEALEAAEQGDYSVMERLLKVLGEAYAYKGEHMEYASLPTDRNCSYKTFCGT